MMAGKSKHKISIILTSAQWKKTLPNYKKLCKDICILSLDKVVANKYPLAIQLSVLLTDDKIIQGLNLRFRGKDKPTNVLSFPALSKKEIRSLGSIMGQREPTNKTTLFIGEIALSFDTIQKEATKYNKSFKNHLLHMIVHSVLHLFGHDHRNKKDRNIMEKAEIEILKMVGISNPYILT